jgi:hypothetical protein
VLEREILGEFVLEQKLADGLLVAVRNGLRLWSIRTRDSASRWPAARVLAFVAPPSGVSIDCGWTVTTSGEAGVVPPPDGKWGLPSDGHSRTTSSNDIFALGRLRGGEVAKTVVIWCVHGRRPRGLQPCLKPRATREEIGLNLHRSARPVCHGPSVTVDKRAQREHSVGRPSAGRKPKIETIGSTTKD